MLDVFLSNTTDYPQEVSKCKLKNEKRPDCYTGKNGHKLAKKYIYI